MNVVIMMKVINIIVIAQLCSAQTLAHKPALRRPDPQKYTYSYQFPISKKLSHFVAKY